MNRNKHAYHPEKGSAFFYILLAVVLFGTLAFTVSRGMRGQQTKAMSGRKAELAASEIMTYSAQVAQRVDSIRRKNISESDIDFASSKFSRHNAAPPAPWAENPNCLDTRCKMFASQGGTLRESTFENYVSSLTLSWSNNYPRQGHPAFYRISALDVGTDAEDLVMEIISLKDEVCAAINKSLALPSHETMDEEAAGSSGTTAQSTSTGYWDFSNTQTSEPLFDEAIELQGKTQGCYRQNGYGNTYFKILIER